MQLNLGTRPIYVSVELFQNTPRVHIRHYFEPSPGVWQPTKRGVALDSQEWENFKTYIQEIDQELNHQLTLRTLPDVTRPSEFHPKTTPAGIRKTFDGFHQ